ncbi:MAG: XRE family transcriptional regulator [Acidobacteria bacterium]|nr:XRE family transcriptional regulator [Acidobacteriota bacterium]
MIGDRVRHARELSGLTQGELAEKCDVAQATVAMIERDALMPSPDFLRRLTRATSFPAEFFMNAPDWEFPLGSLSYRKFSKLRAAERTKSHRLAQQSFELYEFLAARLKTPRVALGKMPTEQPQEAARLTRTLLGLSATGPVRGLVSRLERSGIRVFFLPEVIEDPDHESRTEIENVDGFSIWVEGAKPVIAVNGSRPGDRIRLTLAHELGHLVLHYPFHAEQDIEREAYLFGAEFLFPEESFRAELHRPVTLAKLAELKARWGVSMSAILYRARELDIVSDRQHKYLRMHLGKRGWTKCEPVDIPIEAPRALHYMADLAYRDDRSHRALADDAHLPLFWINRIFSAQAAPRRTEVPGQVVSLTDRRKNRSRP